MIYLSVRQKDMTKINNYRFLTCWINFYQSVFTWRKFIPAIPVLVALILSSCGESFASSETSQEMIEGQEISLEEAAGAEGGELVFYTSTNLQDLEYILQKFKQTYPFIRTDYYRSSGDTVVQKLITETQAGQHFADVIEIQPFETFRLIEAGLIQSYIVPESEIYPENAKDPEGLWVVDRINTVVIGYNTDMVSEYDVPDEWDDLLDPKWEGQIGVEVNDIELMAGMAKEWGDEKAFAFWEGIAALKPGLVTGHTELAELVAAGEFAISPTLYGYRIERMKSAGAPIDWVKTDQVVAYSELISLAADAPHPAAAKLFINWMLSETGQKVIQDLGRIPARPGIEADPKILTEGLHLIYTVPSMAEKYDYYAEKWKEFFSLE